MALVPSSIPMVDPTKPSGGEINLDASLYIEDPGSQRQLALLILQDHFPYIAFRDICNFSDYSHAEYRRETWLFVDTKEADEVERNFYFLEFAAYKGGPVYGHQPRRHVDLTWTDTVAVRNARDKKIYHLKIPFPREAYLGLESVRATVLDASLIDAQVNDEIELRRVEPEHSFVWPPDYVPKIINNRHLRFHSLQMGREWKEAFPGDLLIPWEEFLRCYGGMQPDDWVSDLRYEMTYAQKRKLILDAVRRKDLVPWNSLAMLGVGPVEDCMGEELMSDLETLDLTADDEEVRMRLCETIAGIYVHGESDEIQRRWKALLRRIASVERLQSLQTYFDRLAD